MYKLEEYGKSLLIPDDRLLKLSLECLKSSGKLRLLFIKTNGTHIRILKRDFLNTFWTKKKQREIRLKIENDRYHNNNGKSMLSHFSKYVNLASFLEPKIFDEELLNSLVRHYPTNLQINWIARRGKSLKYFATYLLQGDSVVQNQASNKPQEYKQRYLLNHSTQKTNQHQTIEPILQHFTNINNTFHKNKTNNRETKKRRR